MLFRSGRNEAHSLPAGNPADGEPYRNAEDTSLWNVVANSLGSGTGWRDARIDFKVIGDADVEDAAFDKGDERIIVLM